MAKRDVPCTVCNKPMWRTNEMAAEPTCRECRRLRRAQQGTKLVHEGSCLHCGLAFPLTKASRKFCSDDCQRKAYYGSQREQRRSDLSHSCTWCGKPSPRPDKSHNRPCCSALCRTYLCQFDLGNVSRPWPKVYPCRTCGKPHSSRARDKSKALCEDCRRPALVKPPRPRFVSVQCPRCGLWWVGDRKTGSNQERYCSAACGTSDARDRKRARKRAAFVAPVYRHRIYERDKWTCHICGKKVHKSRKVPHPMAPTIDHLIPLADPVGGTHEPANVATAHFICNARKGDRGGGEQLMLVG